MDIALKLDPDEGDVRAVRDGLIAFNRKASGREAGWQPFVIHLRDPANGQPVGGLTGFTTFDWVFVELFHVPEHLRGQGHGRALMERTEAFGLERGCIGIWLDTFSFQARAFYEKLGFSVFGTLEDHPVGGRRYFMSKRLDAANALENDNG